VELEKGAMQSVIPSALPFCAHTQLALKYPATAYVYESLPCRLGRRYCGLRAERASIYNATKKKTVPPPWHWTSPPIKIAHTSESGRVSTAKTLNS
jgi:hypothetical protein